MGGPAPNVNGISLCPRCCTIPKPRPPTTAWQRPNSAITSALASESLSPGPSQGRRRRLPSARSRRPDLKQLGWKVLIGTAAIGCPPSEARLRRRTSPTSRKGREKWGTRAYSTRKRLRDRGVANSRFPSLSKCKRNQTTLPLNGHICRTPRHVPPDSGWFSKSEYCDPSASPASWPRTSPVPST